MSKSVPIGDCSDFQAHQWKKDICVNCMRARAAHKIAKTASVVQPRKPRPRSSVPVTPPTVPTATKARDMKMAFLADGETSPTKQPDSVNNKKEGKVNQRDKIAKQTCNEEKKKTQGIETTLSKSKVMNVTTGRSTSVDASSSSDKSAKPDLARSQSAKEDVSGRRSNRKQRMTRPALPPPQAPPPKTPDALKNQTDSLHLDDIPAAVLEDIQKQLSSSKDSNFHYYHKYDVTGSLRRQQPRMQPAIVNIETRLASASPEEKAELLERIRTTLGKSAVDDVLPNDITVDKIAMPYNIVDVSAQLPRDIAPPKLPSSPAPRKDDSIKKGLMLNGTKKKEDNEPSQPVSPLKEPYVAHAEINGRHIQHTYEPINDLDWSKDIPFADDTSPKKAFVRASPVRATAPVRGPLASSWKSTDNGNKMQASLEHLDLSHSQSPSPPSPSKASPEIVVDTTDVKEEQKMTRKTSGKNKEKVKKEKPAASANSGGGFFKRFFGFGRRDSSNTEEMTNSREDLELSTGSMEDSFSAATSTQASAAQSVDDLSSNQEALSDFAPSSSPISVSPLTMSPVLSGLHPEGTSVDIEDEPKKEDRVNNFVSFTDEMSSYLKEKNIKLEVSEPKTEEVTLVGATSLTDEIMDMLSNFGGDQKSPKQTPSPKVSSTKPSLPSSKPPQRQRSTGPKPTSPSMKPPSPPVPKPRPDKSDKLGELTIDIERASGRASGPSSKSPQVSFVGVDSPRSNASPVHQSVSQSSLLSDGSGSSGKGSGEVESATLTRKPRPRSTAVSRKMLNAPPPPPPVDKRRSDGSGPASPISPKPGGSLTSSPTKTSMPKMPMSPKVKEKPSDKPQSPRHIEISAPIAVTSTLDTCQTLPKPIKKRDKNSPDTDLKKSVDDLTEYRKKKRGDSLAKHARNKTVTEGISFDIESFASFSDDDRISQLLENGNKKFVNRALPPPPTLPVGKPGEDGNYEFVNTVEGPATTGIITERGNYEDVDSLYSAIPADDTEYLQPVSHTFPLVSESKPKPKPKSQSWTPKAAKRLADWANKKIPKAMTESYVMVYANTEILLDKDKPAVTLTDGFSKMSSMNQQTLHTLADTILRNHCPSNPHFSEELSFDDFGIGDSEPVLTQGCVCMYRVRQAKIQPYNGYLMLSAKSLHRGFLDQQSCHLVSPSILISDRISAEYFPEPSNSSDPDHYQLYGQVQTNMALLHYNTILPLQTYINELSQRTATRSAAEEYERQVCYCLAQIFCAVLDSYSTGPDSLYAIKTLSLKDICVVSLSKSEEKYLVLNAASQNHCDDVDYDTLVKDILQVLGHFLHVNSSIELSDQNIPVKSRYSQGLCKFVLLIKHCTFESLIQGKNLLEYLLWGPCAEDHAVLMAASDSRQAFTVWLEVARCKAVTDAAIDQLEETVYTANRLKFLCCATGMSLSETAVLLN